MTPENLLFDLREHLASRVNEVLATGAKVEDIAVFLADPDDEAISSLFPEHRGRLTYVDVIRPRAEIQALFRSRDITLPAEVEAGLSTATPRLLTCVIGCEGGFFLREIKV